MGKILSDTERRLQKKLIPLNIFVCILSLVAALSLLFTPFIKVDIGKILRDESTITLVNEKVDQMVGGSLGDSDGASINFSPVVSAIVSNVLSSAEGDISISAYGASKVAFAKGDDKSGKVLEELFFSDKGLVNSMINSVADAVVGMFETGGGGTGMVEEMIVSAVATSLATNLPPEAAEKINSESLPALTDKFRKLNEVESREQAETAINSFVDAIDEVFGDIYDMSESRDTVVGYVLELYDDTIEELGKKDIEEFSVEAMISVAVSKNVDLSNFNLPDIFAALRKGLDGEDNNEGGVRSGRLVSYALTEGEGEGEGGSETGNETEGEDGNENGNGNENEPGSEGNVNICTNYGEILAAMGLGADELDELKDTLRTTIRSSVDKLIEPYSNYMAYYGYIFYGMLVFIVPWLILFLFSFFHMLAKNKRFTMWYVKLYSFLPALIFYVAPKLAPMILGRFLPQIFEGEMGPVIKAALSGISSFTWISGICYILLWLVSIFWAFPIKHKIRKERKACKRAMKNGTYNPAPYVGADAQPYGDSYDNTYGGYGSDSYDSGYGSSLGGYDDGGFGEPFTGGYDNYGSDSYGGYDSYGSDPYGGYGSDSYDSGYGSSYGGYSSYNDDDDDF